MKTIKYMMMAAVATLALGSCVSKKEYLAVQQQLQECLNGGMSLGKKYSDAQIQLAEFKTKTENLQHMLDDKNALIKEKNEALQIMQKTLDQSIYQGGANISKLVDEINSSNKYIQQLVEAKSKSDSLNVALTNNLTRSLSREELKDVDIQVLKGVVYISLNDNMLYKSGSYEISPKAGETLSKIAKIITDYDDYEVLVEGNTDNVPISRTNIRNNWDLSALRASSVVQELQTKYGVNPSRLSAAGRGEYNTVADNDTPEGRAKNRRTQIIITPKLDQFLELIDKAPATDEETAPAAEAEAATEATQE
jgi:chemotaxis protein MotB